MDRESVCCGQQASTPEVRRWGSRVASTASSAATLVRDFPLILMVPLESLETAVRVSSIVAQHIEYLRKAPNIESLSQFTCDMEGDESHTNMGLLCEREGASIM